MKPYSFVSEKYKKSSLVSPEDWASYLHKSHKIKVPPHLPSRAILCFWSSLAQSLKKRADFQESLPVNKTGLNIDLYKKQDKGKQVSVSVVSRFGIGAPAGVTCLEVLRAYGVKEFISIGVVGALNPNLKIGSKVLIKKSFRDEGCSYHYKAPSPYVEVPKRGTYLTLMKQLKLQPVVSWTTDAPFRETKEEVLYFRSKGVECVEMESSALMAVGEYYGVSVFCLGVVSDHLSPQAWTPQFFNPVVKKSLSEILNRILFL